ncbi:oligosaccharide flippase family protein [Alistipes sp.]|uniref:oligosaccharide flippase family protein n=1 Tax=Alistipes sp. TaxID=1872444 RepID=UPI003A85F651
MPIDKEENKRRIFKNTFALYLRTAIAMVVSLVVTRILLKELGEDNYGIYNVVASVVVLFSFLNASMAQAIQRFITFALGKGDLKRTNEVFSTSVVTQILITLLLIVICETIGVWFINRWMVIDGSRLTAVNWAFQFSILTFAVNFLRVPYESSIIAYEKMSFFAYATIGDSLIKLAIVYLLAYSPIDRLIFYTQLLFLESVIMLGIYYLHCRVSFPVCRFKWIWDRKLFRDIFSFSGWNVFGSMANIFSQKGIVIFLNLFVGIVANAAMGIANQVNGALNSFINSFQTSFRPQIVKAYAAGEYDYLLNMISATSKFSFILIYIPAVLIVVNAQWILNVWLTEVPAYTVRFCQLITICCMIDAMTGPYNCAILATGRIKRYQLALSLSCLLDVMLCFTILKLGVSANYVLYSRILTRGIINMFIGLHFMEVLLDFRIIEYCRKVILPVLCFLLLHLPFLIVGSRFYEGWQWFWISGIYVLTFGGLGALFIILRKEERRYLFRLVLRK